MRRVDGTAQGCHIVHAVTEDRAPLESDPSADDCRGVRLAPKAGLLYCGPVFCCSQAGSITNAGSSSHVTITTLRPGKPCSAQDSGPAIIRRTMGCFRFATSFICYCHVITLSPATVWPLPRAPSPQREANRAPRSMRQTHLALTGLGNSREGRRGLKTAGNPFRIENAIPSESGDLPAQHGAC